VDAPSAGSARPGPQRRQLRGAALKRKPRVGGMHRDHAAAIRAGLQRWLARPDVKSAKASVVGYSLGGWLAISFANRMPEQVSAVVAFYSSTFRIADVGAWLATPPASVPTLLLAGVRDTYMNCCTIERAREIAAAAAAPATRSPIEVVEVPDANHGFALAAYPSYRPAEAAATFARALEHLRKFGAGAR